ncbi:Probable amino-acid import ATP-binding protein YxeO [Raoultella ornithinolytica]|nr:Probable amino-acid import ATP-binding protein YxeO [Raoultella ornithinolytica]
MPDTTAVSIKNVSKQFDNIEVLRDINLTVEKGSVVSILGSSGSGKSTLLRCMNWLEQPDRGEIHIGGQRLGIDEQNGKAMSHRQLSKIRERVGMVFQSFNLWPHLTVQQNVSEALLHVKGMKRDEASAIAIQQLEKGRDGAQGRRLADYPLRRAEAAGGHCPFAGDVAGSDSV